MFTPGRPRAFAIRSASGVFPVPGGRQSRAPAPALSDAHDDPVQGNSPGSPSGSPSRQQLPSRSTPPGATRARPRSAGCVLRSLTALVHDPGLPGSARPEPISGTPVNKLSVAQIMHGKLQRDQMGLVRDAYDVNYAHRADPSALETAGDSLTPEHIRRAEIV